MNLLWLTCFLLISFSEAASHFKHYYKNATLLRGISNFGADVGDQLILTPYLDAGQIDEAQQAALVEHSSLGGIVSYAGYFTVDAIYDSNLWFWYFPSADNVIDDPVVLWLNGGPGVSSLYGLFTENGPFVIDETLTITPREYSWNRNQSVIYIDQPVGVGFSTTTNGGLAKNESLVGEHMFIALTQFFQLFPNLQNNPFYISGESYAGKYLPAIGHAILINNPNVEIPINLQGILIGDGWTYPEKQLNYGPLVYNAGLVSAEVKAQIDSLRDKAVELIQQEQWLNASDYSNEIIDVIMELSGVDIYNYLQQTDPPDYWAQVITQDSFRLALHVGNTLFGDKGAGDALSEDEVQSVAPWVEELLEVYPILIYTGQVDIICGYPMVLDYLTTLNFTGAGEYKNNDRQKWLVDDVIAGYVRTGGNLQEVLVRNAGHMVPSDQPKHAYDMLYKFTRHQSLV